MLTLDNLLIGEMAPKDLINIKNAITSLSIDLTSTMVSELKFTVFDETLSMFNANYFVNGRRVTYQDEQYLIASTTVSSSSKGFNIEVKARSKATEDMRRAKGNQSFGTISPSIFAKNMADKYGLKIFAEDSSPDGEIKQESNDKDYESIWMVLQRLAGDLDFLCFEARGVLFFASMQYIIDHAEEVKVNTPPIVSTNKDDFYAVKFSLTANEDDKTIYSGSASLIANVATTSLYPGVVLNFPALKQFSKIKFMVERVRIDLGRSELVSVSFRSPEENQDSDSQCTLQTFQRGSKGECVKRIQKAVLTIVDGDFGPMTEAAVKAYQTFYGHSATGIVAPDDKGEPFYTTLVYDPTRPSVRTLYRDWSTWELIVNPPEPYVKGSIASGNADGAIRRPVG